MNESDQAGSLQIGSIFFYVCWFVCILVVTLVLIFGVRTVQSAQGFFLLLILLCLMMFPFLKSFSIGKVFSVQVRELTNSVEKMRDSVQNLVSLQLRSTQNVIVSNLNAPDGRNVELETEAKSQEYSKQAYSLSMQGRYLEAIKYYEKAFKRDPNNWVAALSLGYLYLSLEDLKVDQDSWGFDDSERLLRSVFYSTYATQKDPNHYMQFMNLGIALGHLGGVHEKPIKHEKLIKLGLDNLEKGDCALREHL